jgi:hypothetical protein
LNIYNMYTMYTGMYMYLNSKYTYDIIVVCASDNNKKKKKHAEISRLTLYTHHTYYYIFIYSLYVAVCTYL